MKAFKDLIYTPETVKGEVISKVKSHTPKIDAPDTVKAGEKFKVRIKIGPHPNKPEHSIRKIELYLYEEGRPFNPILLGCFEIAPIYMEPDIVITLTLKKKEYFM